jgi:GxxExxY protein
LLASSVADAFLKFERLTHSIIGAFYETHRNLPFGLLEHLYVMALERELRARGHQVAREVSVTVYYKGEELGVQRLDMVVDGKVVVEVKATEHLHPDARRQLLCYLCCTKLEVGLLLHFGPKPKFFRVVSSNEERSAPSANSAESS